MHASAKLKILNFNKIEKLKMYVKHMRNCDFNPLKYTIKECFT